MQHELESLFSEVGTIVEVFLPTDRNTGRPRGFAFVEFEDESVISTAIERFDGHDLGGRSLRVTAAEERPSRAPRVFGEDSSGGHFGPKRPSKPKGSRRNARRKKRSL